MCNTQKPNLLCNCFNISDHVFKALEFADKTSDTDYKKDTVIHNPQIIRDVVKISGFRFKIISNPDKETEEEEVSCNATCIRNLLIKSLIYKL